MCVYSVILDYGQRRIHPDSWTSTKFNGYKRFLEIAKEVDKQLDQPDCEDVEKEKWLRELEERIKEQIAKEVKDNVAKFVNDTFSKKLPDSLKRLQDKIDRAYREFNQELNGAKGTF
jgi:anaerobic ribonucleoside-triphosphate reductase